jgi:hypothetical protein
MRMHRGTLQRQLSHKWSNALAGPLFEIRKTIIMEAAADDLLPY